jgi:hypothetical protein
MTQVIRNPACAALGIAALALGACHSGSGGKSGTGALAAASVDATPPSAGPSGIGMLGGGGSAAPSSHAAAGPAIVYFKVTQPPQCEIKGTSAAPFSRPEQPVRLAWKVTGASGVALSIDDPGFFKAHHSGSYHSYGPEGSVELSFPCTDTAKPSTTHTYTLDTLGDTTKEKTISVSAQNPPT